MSIWPFRPNAPDKDPCPQCWEASLEPYGAKMRCPRCFYIQPCCQP